jgi:hypothetical protein
MLVNLVIVIQYKLESVNRPIPVSKANLHHHAVQHDETHCPVTRVLARCKMHGTSLRVVGAARCGGAVRKRTVEDECFRAVYIRNGDEGLVKRGVAAVADEIVDVRLIAVLVAATDGKILAETHDGERLVAAGRLPCRERPAVVVVVVVVVVGALVVEAVGVVVVVWVCVVEPEAGHDGEQEDGRD